MFAQPSDAILARLMTLHPKLIDLSLDRVVDLLDKLGNPHHRLPPVVHIAGTNGKGSVAAYMRAAPIWPTACSAARMSTAARRSPISKSPLWRPSSPSPKPRPISSCWKSGWGAGWMPPT
jgi:hypothetical protein